MTEILNGGASVPAGPAAGPQAPQTQAQPTQPNPPAAERPLPDPKPTGAGKDGEAEPKPAVTAREALKRAAEKLARAEASRPGDGASRPGDSASRPGDGTDKPDAAAHRPATEAKSTKSDASGAKPAEQQSKSEAPARFSADAKAAWAAAPEPIRAEVHRAIRELEQGHEKYRADAEAFSQVKEFDELARRNNTSLRDAMTRYINLERTLLTNPLDGIEAVCDFAGVSLHELAAAVTGQAPDQHQSHNDATIRALRQEISGLKQQIGGVTSSLEQQHRSGIETAVDDFASNNPRFEELADDIVFFIESGRTRDLAEAYQMADRLNPAPSALAPSAPGQFVTASTAPAAFAADLEAQTRKGSKSVSGAPSLGSDPGTGKRSTSIRESLSRAMARAR